jgi:chromosome segregation ATPase
MRPYFVPLMDAPQSPERDELVLKYLRLCDECDAFLAQSKSGRISQLEAQRTELWAACRQEEDSAKSLLNEIGILNGQVNAAAARLNAVRAKVNEASASPYDTSFPSAKEIAIWNEKRAAVKAELAATEADAARLQGLLRSTESAHRDATKTLRTRIDELRAVESELNGLKSK